MSSTQKHLIKGWENVVCKVSKVHRVIHCRSCKQNSSGLFVWNSFSLVQGLKLELRSFTRWKPTLGTSKNCQYQLVLSILKMLFAPSKCHHVPPMGLFLEWTSSEEPAQKAEVLKHPKPYLNTSTLLMLWARSGESLKYAERKAHYLKGDQRWGRVGE